MSQRLTILFAAAYPPSPRAASSVTEFDLYSDYIRGVERSPTKPGIRPVA